MAEVIDLVAGSLAEAAPDAERHGVTICLEAHDAFCRSEEAASVLRQVDSPYVKAVWDVHHPYRMGECEVPCREILDLLAARGYNGFICAEWEKKWRCSAARCADRWRLQQPSDPRRTRIHTKGRVASGQVR